MNWKVSWNVSIAGQDRSSAMSAYLISIEVSESEGKEGDKATLSFDDTDGRLRLPKKGDEIIITLNGTQAFIGVVDDVDWSVSRGQGRVLNVTVKPLTVPPRSSKDSPFTKMIAQRKSFSKRQVKKQAFRRCSLIRNLRRSNRIIGRQKTKAF